MSGNYSISRETAPRISKTRKTETPVQSHLRSVDDVFTTSCLLIPREEQSLRTSSWGWRVMKIVIIGSGLIGVTSAYLLRRRGHEVTVIERREGPGQETSFANGAFLSPSMPEPWNAPGCWRVLLASLGRSDAPLQLRLRALPSLARWGLEFLRNSQLELYQRNTVSNLRMALHSMEVLQSLRNETLIEYDRKSAGAVKIFRSSAALAAARSAASRLSRDGLIYRTLSPQETVRVEPGLLPIASQLKGGIYYAGDEVGDAYRFCSRLGECARAEGVEFAFGTTVSALEVRSRTIAAVRTRDGRRLIADQYVLAAGSYTASLAGSLGLRLPVKPAKGYSVTFRWRERSSGLRVPIIDDDLHAAIVPLGGALRVAGTAEFAGFDLALRPERVRNLVNLAHRVLPSLDLAAADAKPWCGLRPMSADGVPIIGPTQIPNLWVSTGHGHLGWTMAAGSAELLADLMCGEPPALDPSPYAPSRFASHC